MKRFGRVVYSPETHVLIKDHVLGIPERLKQIEDSYYVLWNKKKGKFEVHNWRNIGNTYCLEVPWDALDDRILELVRATRIERVNVKELSRRIDASYEKAEKDNVNRLKDEVSAYAADIWNAAHAQHKGVDYRIKVGNQK